MKKKQDDYLTTRIWKTTHSRLRIIAALTDKSVVETLDRLSKEELERIQQQQSEKK
jgi:hypothetical protein